MDVPFRKVDVLTDFIRLPVYLEYFFSLYNSTATDKQHCLFFTQKLDITLHRHYIRHLCIHLHFSSFLS